jgi:hypothetical protein
MILHDLFTETNFFPWLESLPANQSSFTTLIRFEKLLFLEAQARHTWEWWHINHKSKPATCFRPSLIPGSKGKIGCVGHPINGKSRRTYSWSAYRDIIAYEQMGRKIVTGSVTNDDWVLL